MRHRGDEVCLGGTGVGAGGDVAVGAGFVVRVALMVVLAVSAVLLLDILGMDRQHGM